MKLQIRESIDFDSKSNLTFVKLDPDRYEVMWDDESVGIIWCKNFYSQPRNKVWNVDIDLDNFTEHDTANSIADAKQTAKRLFKSVFERCRKWHSEMD